MNPWISFIIGLLIGGAIGVVVMALLRYTEDE